MNPQNLHIDLIPALQDNYIAVLVSPEQKVCAAIDPSEAPPVLSYLEDKGLKLIEIWNTHHHWDHVGGNEALHKETGAKVYCSDHDRKRVPAASYGLLDGESLSFAGLNFQVISIPGHTLGHIALYSHQAEVLFSGDTLFSIGCGRLFEGSPEQMFRSLQRLLDLPETTQIYCGHEYTEKNIEFALHLTPDHAELLDYQKKVQALRSQGLPSLPSLLSTEKKLNPFLRASSSREFEELRKMKDEF